MTRQVSIDRGTLELLYYNNKQYIIPFLTITICVFLFFQIIIPQFQDIVGLWNKEKEIKSNIEIYKKNLDSLKSLQQNSIDSHLRIATSALPPGKDFVGILSSIGNASNKSQAKVGDYSLSIGELGNSSNPKTIIETNLLVNLSLSGSISEVRSFIKTISLSAPIAEISSIEYKDNIALVKVAFYFKPFPLIQIDYKKAVTKLSRKEEEKIKEISSWDNVVQSSADSFGLGESISTGSAGMPN